MTGSLLARAASISDLMYSGATQLSSPQELRQRLIDSRMGSGRSPQNAQLTSMTRSAGRLPNPARAPNPPAANTALSRSVRNVSHTYSVIDTGSFFWLRSSGPWCCTRSENTMNAAAAAAIYGVQPVCQGFVHPREVHG